MKVYVLLGYDEDWYTFESYLGVFSSREKAEDFRDNDYTEKFDGSRLPNHEEYQIIEEIVDDPIPDKQEKRNECF